MIFSSSSSRLAHHFRMQYAPRFSSTLRSRLKLSFFRNLLIAGWIQPILLPSHFLSSMICGPSLRAKEIERKLRWISLPSLLRSVSGPDFTMFFSCLPAPTLFLLAIACQRIIAAFVLGSHSGANGMLALPSPPYPGKIISEASMPSLLRACMHVIHFRCLVLRVIITAWDCVLGIKLRLFCFRFCGRRFNSLFLKTSTQNTLE